MSSLSFQSDSEGRTQSFGRALGSVIRKGDAVLLHGEMGAGKTCMARGIAQGADCEVSARSPTFIIVAEYPGRVRIFHCDLYRITGAAEVHDLALDETLDRGALIVEWPENADGALPQDACRVFIEPENDRDCRKISVFANGPVSRSFVRRLEIALAEGTDL